MRAFDCVLGFYLNPLTSGVAKFNLLLAQQLGIPVLSLFDEQARQYRHALMSFKTEELNSSEETALAAILERFDGNYTYSLFLHKISGSMLENKLISGAKLVYCGNEELVYQLRDLRPDAVGLWCPGLLQDPRPFPQTELTVFSFGMAHKIRTPYYEKLAHLLEATGKTYSLYLSTALHESTPLSDAFANFNDLYRIFGAKLFFMGYLSDVAVYNHLLRSTFLAAFFADGVRANNTTVNAAMELGAVVITNLDDYSPANFVHGVNLIDIRSVTSLPTASADLATLSHNARTTMQHFTWDKLTAALTDHRS